MQFTGFEILKKLSRPIPGSLIQVGAHNAEEVSAYRAYGVESAILIDPLDNCIASIKAAVADSPSYIPVQAVCSNTCGKEIKFHVASNWGASSSILPPANHINAHPEVSFDQSIALTTTTVDKIVADVRLEYGLNRPFEFIFLDCQGAELMVLQGAQSALTEAKYVYTEVSHGGLYEGDVSFFDMLSFMRVWGFDLYDLEMNSKKYGDALFIKRDI
ncbi:FkbM family methyltransferase [Methylorubrum sp. GM97]|uniref:FkbM family methyltransferase n=1 Tax=Methylorubrum sp. GM97 TaxID=2938232 RepID=UPI0021C4ADD0|nr:FkbM family methyltransferase [Methylorubrum sp. GM97]